MMVYEEDDIYALLLFITSLPVVPVRRKAFIWAGPCLELKTNLKLQTLVMLNDLKRKEI